jgi:hypothetical protein
MIRKSVAEILDHHVTFELEAIDRMYLNAYMPSLQTGGGVVYFVKTQLGVRVPSTVMVAPNADKIDAVFRKWLRRLPHPLPRPTAPPAIGISCRSFKRSSR